MKRPIVVYLDSSDFSTLSDPARKSPENDEIRAALLRRARSGEVVFAFSGVHLSEMTPLEPGFTPSALARTDLLVELCERNAFISIDRLLEAETSRLGQVAPQPVQPLTADATWFPEIVDFMSPIKWADMRRDMLANIGKHAVNRAQRRLIKRKVGTGTRISPKMERHLSTPSTEGLTEIMRMYPMRREDALILQSHIYGRASAKDAEEAFLSSLRDPRWMVLWFSEHHDQLSPALQWLRAAAVDMVARMEEIARFVRDQRQRHPEAVGDLWRQDWWQHEQDRLLVQLAMSASSAGSVRPIPTATEIDRVCRGLSCMMRTLHSVLWDAIAASGRTPKASDTVDAMHALYAPYCDIFRADRYMAPHIRRQLAGLEVKVVSRLAELPSLIEECLNTGKMPSVRN
ncbi:hypothetical protein [Paraburkholderia sp. GAS42]|uniref:hypothetical protein n=1 Tax=Paraburkholderia sp. GAS42 TaxID=3035135 RepID=UPI003D1C0EED